ncbi:MAG: trypsin-like peptidase domain-containing protein [Gemmatimonadota bacterium]
MKGIRGDLVAAALAALLLGAGALWLLTARGPSGLERAIAVAQETTGSIDMSRRTAIVAAAQRVGPSVVSVNVVATQIVHERGAGPFMGDPFFERLFPPRYRERQVEGLGSGFIVSEDGYVLTNDHVVRGATEIVITLLDGRQFPARLVGTDPATDLAVLKVEARDLPIAPLGNSDDLLIGEWAIAIGNPFGYLLADPNPSVTVGVVSAVGRDVRSDPGVSPQGQVWSNMIQTDAAINPGNSGGPLVNAQGEVIGVNAFIFSGGSGGSIGLGFAIPINRAQRVLTDIVHFGEIRHPWVGVHLADAESGNGMHAQGALVRRVDPGSPADRAGIRPGDRIVAAGGRPLRSAIEWEGRLLDQPSEESFGITVARGANEIELEITPRDDPLRRAERQTTPFGAELVPVDETLASYLGLKLGYGLYLASLDLDSPLRRLGLADGDVLLRLNDRRLDAADDVTAMIDVLRSGQPFVLTYEHDGTAAQACYRTLC